MTARGTSPQLDVYDIACLAGGPDRVVDTALVAMIETGRIRVHLPGQLAVADPTRRHPVEAAVLDAVGTRGHRSVDVIRWRLADDDRVLAICRRLVDAGLLSRWTVVPRRTEHARVPTAAGRRLLRSLEAEPPALPAWDGGTAVLVALHGREQMTDRMLAAAFEPLPATVHAGRVDGLRQRIDATRDGAENQLFTPPGGFPNGGAG
jgi:hypothetical protein